jgi:predicted metal-binding protein
LAAQTLITFRANDAFALKATVTPVTLIAFRACLALQPALTTFALRALRAYPALITPVTLIAFRACDACTLKATVTFVTLRACVTLFALIAFRACKAVFTIDPACPYRAL